MVGDSLKPAQMNIFYNRIRDLVIHAIFFDHMGGHLDLEGGTSIERIASIGVVSGRWKVVDLPRVGFQNIDGRSIVVVNKFAEVETNRSRYYVEPTEVGLGVHTLPSEVWSSRERWPWET